MKNIFNSSSKFAVSIKLIAFFSWFSYIVFAILNAVLIEAFLFSVAFLIISYLIFGKEQMKKHSIASPDNNKIEPKPTPHNQNYLSVFFHSAS
jgi:hypothetical protein